MTRILDSIVEPVNKKSLFDLHSTAPFFATDIQQVMAQSMYSISIPRLNATGSNYREWSIYVIEKLNQ